MAASDFHARFERPPRAGAECLTAPALRERLEEEVSRAERHGTLLSCVLVAIDDLEEMAREHGSALREQTIDYVAGALRAQLRRFDRVGRVAADGPDGAERLMMLLPGADSARGEIVARRALQRLRTIKLETDGARRPLRVSMGLAVWQREATADTLLAQAFEAMRGVEPNGNGAPGVAGAPSHYALRRVDPDTPVDQLQR